MASNRDFGFAVWITGLPSSGKSTLTAALVAALKKRGIDVAVLESDELRKTLTPNPSYSEAERETFYGTMVFIGKLLTDHGVPVIFDATANRRAYRESARRQIGKFVEVYVDCPLEVCTRRDTKGIYRKGIEGDSKTVPGVQVPYERPACPDVVIRSDQDAGLDAAERVLVALNVRGWLHQ